MMGVPWLCSELIALRKGELTVYGALCRGRSSLWKGTASIPPSFPFHGPPRCWPESLSRHAEAARSSRRPPLWETLSSPRSTSPRVPSLPSKPTDPGKTEQTHLPPPTLSPSLLSIPHL